MFKHILKTPLIKHFNYTTFMVLTIFMLLRNRIKYYNVTQEWYITNTEHYY